MVWERILKPNESEFQEAFSGFRNSKERFRDEVLRRYTISCTSVETRDNLVLRAKTLFAQKPEKCPSIILDIDDVVSEISEIENSEIWSKVIIGNKDLPIGQFIEALDNADWVNQGRKYLKEDGVCPFCQNQTITNELKNQLDAFFGGEYEKDVNLIKNFISRYTAKTEVLLKTINETRKDIALSTIAGIDVSKIDSIIEILGGYFSKNSGIGRIMNSYAEFVAKPEFYSTDHHFSVILPNRSVAELSQLEFAETQLSGKKTQLSNEKTQLSQDKKQLSQGKKQLSMGMDEPDWELSYFKEVVIGRKSEGLKNKTVDGIIEIFDRYRYSYNFNRRNIADLLNVTENRASRLIKKCMELGIMNKVKRDEYCFIAGSKENE